MEYPYAGIIKGGIFMKCAFTGPQPKSLPFRCHEDDPAYDDLTQRIIKEVVQLCEQGVREYYVGMAAGCDLLCCEVALSMKEIYPDVKVHAVMPFRGQADKWTPNIQAWYKKLIEQCDTAVCLNEKYVDNCYLFRNYYMVDNSNILIAICAPDKIPLRSGTGATVRYARSKGKRIIFVPPVK